MTTERYRSILGLSLTAAATCALLGIVSLSSSAPARALPPRPPTPTPTALPEPTSRSTSESGSIELRVQFPAAWPWREVHWQKLWTVVQWQHPDGTWRDVEGWRGTLDEVTTEDGAIVGHKTWWVAKRDLGTGPFRWRVYRGEDAPLLVTSESFDLPAKSKETVTVEVTLEGVE